MCRTDFLLISTGDHAPSSPSGKKRASKGPPAQVQDSSMPVRIGKGRKLKGGGNGGRGVESKTSWFD